MVARRNRISAILPIYLYTTCCRLGTPNYAVIVKLYVGNAVRLDHLDNHSLEVDRQPPLQLVCAHVEDLEALGERNVWVVVLVEDGETVVSGSQLQGTHNSLA